MRHQFVASPDTLPRPSRPDRNRCLSQGKSNDADGAIRRDVAPGPKVRRPTSLVPGDDHPGHAEAVGDHAEARSEESLGQRHLHLAAVAECREPAVRLRKFGWPWQRPSDAIRVVSPMLRLACITLFSAPGGIMPG
jgi:hypothetical protein